MLTTKYISHLIAYNFRVTYDGIDIGMRVSSFRFGYIISFKSSTFPATGISCFVLVLINKVSETGFSCLNRFLNLLHQHMTRR